MHYKQDLKKAIVTRQTKPCPRFNSFYDMLPFYMPCVFNAKRQGSKVIINDIPFTFRLKGHLANINKLIAGEGVVIADNSPYAQYTLNEDKITVYYNGNATTHAINHKPRIITTKQKKFIELNGTIQAVLTNGVKLLIKLEAWSGNSVQVKINDEHYFIRYYQDKVMFDDEIIATPFIHWYYEQVPMSNNKIRIEKINFIPVGQLAPLYAWQITKTLIMPDGVTKQPLSINHKEHLSQLTLLLCKAYLSS